MRTEGSRFGRRTARRAASLLVLTLVVSGCGSQLDPESVASANAIVSNEQAPVAGVPTAAPSQEGVPDAGAPTIGPDGVVTTPADAGSTGGAGEGSTPGAQPPVPGATNAPSGGVPSGAAGDPTASSTPASPTSSPAVPATVERGACAGFRDQTGVTDDTITIANASDISGPIPGIFQSTQDAVQAFAAYFNATSDICGRKLSVMPLDTRTDSSADQQAYATACSKAFATVGSMAAFDSGGASAAQQCGLPDIRSAIVNGARNACTTCFGAQSGTPNTSADAVPDYFVHTYPDAAAHAGYLYIQAGPSVENAVDEMKAWTQRGMHFVYSSGIDVSAFNYVPYVEQLKDHGVKLVRFLGADDEAVRLARAMTQVGYHPQVFLEDSTAYDQEYVEQGGSDVDGTRVFVNFTPFEDAAKNPELATYLQWLQQVKPGATPTFEGLFAWSAARLFTEQAAELGGRLTRASMVRRLRAVSRWTDHGLHAPQSVGTHVVGPCWRFLRLDDGHWVNEGGSAYHCSTITTVE